MSTQQSTLSALMDAIHALTARAGHGKATEARLMTGLTQAQADKPPVREQVTTLL